MTTPVLPPLSPNAWLRWDVVERLVPAGTQSILEIGCGQGSMGVRLAVGRDYLGVEPDAQSCAVAQERAAAAGSGEVRHGRVEDVVEPGRQFDLVCAFEVIEHIQDDVAALTAWTEYVKPGGTVLLSTPAFAHRYGASDAMVGHYRRYDPRELDALFTSSGLVDPHTVVYGAGLGHALENVRNVLGARRLRKRGLPVPKGSPAGIDLDTMAELTSGSGRLFQPPAAAAGAVRIGTYPWRVLQRQLPSRGTGLVGTARKP